MTTFHENIKQVLTGNTIKNKLLLTATYSANDALNCDSVNRPKI